MSKQLKLPEVKKKGNGGDTNPFDEGRSSWIGNRAGLRSGSFKAPITRRPIVDTRPIAEVAASKSALKEKLAAKYIKHHIGMPSEEDLIEGNNYIVGEKGMYLVIKNKVGIFTTKADRIPFVDTNPEEGFQMKLERRIPHDFLLQTIAFFKKVMKDKGNAEAMVQIFLNNENEYFLHVADQEVSGASVKFKRDAELEKTNLLVLDIHSHNNMGAFFSGTDNADEKEARMYGVIGNLSQEWPAMKFRAGNGNGGWIELDVYQVFETPDTAVEIPEDWIKKVHRPGSGIFGEHSRPAISDWNRRPWSSPYDSGHRGYRRQVFGDDKPWGTRKISFGKVGTAEQDLPLDGFDWDRWAYESGYEDEDFAFEVDTDRLPYTDIAQGIRALAENLEVLPDDDAKGIAIAFIQKLDSRAKDILHEILQGSK